MKLQNLAVIFAIIILPIVIILSYYIHGEVDTIALQTSYDTKLIDSTHDAMSSFEINTANEDLSSVADSLRSIIEASCNVFFNTLATNLGISNAGNSAVDAYVPALLYTLYDGYYIYAPTRIPEVLTDENGSPIYVGDEGVNISGETVALSGSKTAHKYTYTAGSPVKVEYSAVGYELGQMLYKNKDGTYSSQLNDDTYYTEQHILKSYMPYSARYKASNYDLTINYTLDNYITVEGNLNGVYYSKTGYLISADTVREVNVGGVTDILSYNEVSAEERILSGQYGIQLNIDPIMEDGVTRVYGATGEYINISFTPQLDPDGNIMSYTQMNERLTKLYEDQDANIDEIQNLEYELSNLSAINYYVKAQIFSNWVYANLGTIRACDITDDIASLNEGIYTTDSEMDVFHKFKMYDEDGNLEYQDETIIFDSSKNPELEDSPFYTHKLEVIRNNVQYNLNLAISAYNEMLQAKNVQMPVISDSEWEQILTRVSIVSFMQGLNCGMKTYNNYAIASSTNNELTVIPTEIYYTYKEEYNSSDVTSEYHKIDCDNLLSSYDDGSDRQYISFTSKEVKYDKIYNKESGTYIYDHRNMGCYRCAIASNYLKDVYAKDGVTQVRGYSDDIIISLLSKSKRKAYYVAVGKERQNLYKTNALTDSNGFEVFYNNSATTFADIDPSSIDPSDVSIKSFSPNTYVTIDDGRTISKRSISEIREIEITLRDLKCTNETEATVNFKLQLNGRVEIDYNEAVLNLDQKTPQTLVIPVHVLDSDGIAGQELTRVELKTVNISDNVYCRALNIKVIYE